MNDTEKDKVKISVPRYQQIAIDLAMQIAKQQYKPGDKIFARSSLASKYHVSPETARRAICILSEMEIVEASKGSGVVITSVDNAIKYVQQYSGVETMTELRQGIVQNIDSQIELALELKEKLRQLMDRTERFQSSNPFNPFEMVIEADSSLAGKSLSEVNFWHNTTATVIAIKHGNHLLMSPGPYAEIMAGDVIYFVGDENAPMRVEKFIAVVEQPEAH